MSPYQPWASTPAVRAVMQGNRSRDTKPEMALRSALHARGLRYRVGARPVPDAVYTADVVFRSARIAVFVDGCFWHGCKEHGRKIVTNTDYWAAKIMRNQQRDAMVDNMLRDAGWLSVRVWEHESPEKAADRVTALIAERKRTRQAR
jgi:DNA mismatch endonuclease, patch repair protein